MNRSFLPFVEFVFITLLLPSAFGLASEGAFTLCFDPQNLAFEKLEGYDRIKMVGAISSAEPGTPLLPTRFVQIAIPADLDAERVEVTSFEYQELPGTYEIYPAQPFYPLSSLPTKEEEIKFVEPDPSVYESSSEYPGKLAKVTNNGFLGGQHLAGVALYPLQYIPSEGKLILYAQIEFKLIFKASCHFPTPVNGRSQRGADFYSNLARSVVINPEEVGLEARGSLSQEEEVDYLIITDGSFVATFQELADWKILKGISTEVKDVSWVFSNYPGYDGQEKVRNCIKDFYSNHGTKWVLLGGDTDILPHRSAWVATCQEADSIPCDLYYSDLDGDWDANGNLIYGEYEDSVDMYPDIFVGRAPSNDVSQAQAFVNKCLTYEANPPTDYQTRILYAAEVMWSTPQPYTDGAELKNHIDSSFVPDHFQATKLYQTSGNLSWASFRDGLNQGQNIINHEGHGDFDALSIGLDVWFSSDMDSLINAPRFSLFYSGGCITAAIDDDCIAEHFVNNPNGGGFAYCGNTRYGWGMPGAPLRGPSSEFDIEFFRSLFHSGSYQVGKTLGNSKIPFIPLAQEMENPYRWTMFTLLLLGDPTLELWTDIPAELSVSHASIVFADMSYLEVNVVQDSALVSCVKDGVILGTTYSTGGRAMVYFDSPLVTTGTMHVTITKHEYIPYHETVSVVTPDGPCVIHYSHEIDDSGGNSNGAVNPGDTIFMPITVKNIGVQTAYAVSATLREHDDYVVVVDSVKSFGDIDSGMTAESLGDYVFTVDPSCPDNHLAAFTLQATDSESSWVTHFFEMVMEPDFFITAIPETAAVRQGDSTSIELIFSPLGGFNWQLDLNHSELPPEVSGFLDPDQLVPPDSSLLRIYTSGMAYPGIYPVTVTANAGELAGEKEIVLEIAAPFYYGPRWHVSASGHDLIGNGSEEFPFRKIQKGVNNAGDGDTVLVERGRYVERVNFFGKAILLASHFIFDGLESTIESTVIDGDGLGNVVTFDSGEDSNSVIRGFTLTGGYGAYGGGIYCEASSPTIAENFLCANASALGGAGIYCYKSVPKIQRNLITNCPGSESILLKKHSHARVVNNTVCHNTGGGLSIEGGSVPLVKNNIFCYNTYYGIRVSCSSWDISYNDVYGQASDYLSIPDQTGINGNISADPLFVNSLEGDYHLTCPSPCVNAGDPADSVPPEGGNRIDMGTFEYPYEFIRGDANGDCAIDIADVMFLITYLFIGGSPPDPLWVGDCNGDQVVGIADVMYLINYLFLGGSPPGC
jgi:hypothetical protein